MAKNRFQYSRGPVDAAALLVICGWLAIWVLWNRGEPEWRGRSLAPTRVVYLPDQGRGELEDDLIFIRRHDSAPRNGEERIVNASIGIPRKPRLLNARLVQEAGTPLPGNDSLSASASAALSAYAPAWPETRTYTVTEGVEGAFLVAMSQRLQDCGFQLPIDLFEGVDPDAASWQARVHVDCDANGRPRHVFLEEASNDLGLNSWLVRTLYQGTMSVTGATCSGWITLGQKKQDGTE